MMALTVIYRVARPREHSLRNVLPGAMLATLLWWLVNVLFGVYVRRVPYNVVYGGLAAVIGLIIWMQLSAVIIFLGAAWNAELEERREAVRTRGEQIVRVACYAGYKGDERPVRLYFRDKALEIVETEDRWYAPGATFFRVLVEAASGTSSGTRRHRTCGAFVLTAERPAMKALH